MHKTGLLKRSRRRLAGGPKVARDCILAGLVTGVHFPHTVYTVFVDIWQNYALLDVRYLPIYG